MPKLLGPAVALGYKEQVKLTLPLLLVLALGTSLFAADAEPEFLKDPIKLAEHVRTKAVPLDWKSLLSGDVRAFYVGEIHPSSESRRELVRSMKAIKEAGISHLAMEMLGEEHADAVKKYCCDGSCQKDVFASFQKFGWDEEGYMAVAEAATEAGIHLVAIDLPFDIRAAVRAKRDKLKYNSDPAVFEEYCRLGKDLYEKRDQRMAENIAKVLKEDPRSRVLVYAGAFHVRKSTQPKILLDKYGFASRSYHPTGGERAILKTLNEANQRDKPLFIPLPADKMDYDGYINFTIEWGAQKPLRPKKSIEAHGG